MNVLIIDNGTRHLGRLKNLLSDNNLEIKKLFGDYSDVKSNDIIILSGGSQLSITSAPEIFKEEIKLIKKSTKPIIGICEGCEIIAYAYGSRLEFNKRKIKGYRKINPIRKSNLFNEIDKIEAYEAHYWAIKELGKELIGIAKSDGGYEIIKHKFKKIYGLQFHPEMLSNKSNGDLIFRRIFAKLAKKNEGTRLLSRS